MHSRSLSRFLYAWWRANYGWRVKRHFLCAASEKFNIWAIGFDRSQQKRTLSSEIFWFFIELIVSLGTLHVLGSEDI